MPESVTPGVCTCFFSQFSTFAECNLGVVCCVSLTVPFFFDLYFVILYHYLDRVEGISFSCNSAFHVLKGLIPAADSLL